MNLIFLSCYQPQMWWHLIRRDQNRFRQRSHQRRDMQPPIILIAMKFETHNVFFKFCIWFKLCFFLLLNPGGEPNNPAQHCSLCACRMEWARQDDRRSRSAEPEDQQSSQCFQWLHRRIECDSEMQQPPSSYGAGRNATAKQTIGRRASVLPLLLPLRPNTHESVCNRNAFWIPRGYRPDCLARFCIVDATQETNPEHPKREYSREYQVNM